MTQKWLEERWQIFFPTLAGLGKEQEEQIKALCEAELAAWRARPSMRQATSLRNPLTQTRNRIRETLPLTEDNWWLNPKSGEREHLSLKYLNFSSQEWIDQTLPSQQELEARRMAPLLVSDPDGLLTQIQHLFEKKTWQELVLGVGLATGRSSAEILKTGVFTAKTPYSVSFAGPMTVYEVMCEPFEVPTLVRAEQVLEAVAFLREVFGMHFASVGRRDVSRQASPLVREAAYTHFLGRVRLRPPNQDLYRSLAHEIYPRLAVYTYCPSGLDEIVYMATIQNHRKILEASSEEERVTFATAAGYLDYQLVNAAGMRERRRGIRLSDPEVEVLSVFKQWESKPSEDLPVVETRVEPESTEEEMTGDEEDYDDEEVLRQALWYVIVDREGNIDRRQGIRLGQPGVEVLEIFKRQAVEPRADAGVTVKIGERTCWLLDEVREDEQGCSYDAVFTELLNAYDGLYRSGLLAQVKQVAGVALFDLFAHRQDRMQVKRGMQVTASLDLFTFFQKAALTYAHACVKEEEEKGDNASTLIPSEDGTADEEMPVDHLAPHSSMQPSPLMQNDAGVGGVAERKVLLNVSKQTWARFAQAKEELGIASDDDILVLLQTAYYLCYYSDPFDVIDQVETMASMAIGGLRLGLDEQSLIKEAMKYEGVTKAFSFLQESILMYAEAVVSDKRRSDQFSENRQE